ncbi:MAG: SDR family NAD(P)-dependent oxidoreductase, partial [Gammaproteobacteria bacterium]
MAEQPFRGQVALITGSSRGIGRATALLLARRGADIAVHYRRDEEAALAVCSEARAAGVRAVALRADLRDQEAVAALVQQVGAEFGRLDLLVANAASTAFKPLLELAPHNIGMTLDTSVQSLLTLVRAAVPLLVEGTRLPVADALKLGIIHAVVPAAELLDKAKAWILAGGKAEQPWDRKGFRVPGGNPGDPGVQEFLSVAIAKVHERTAGNYPAPINILSCVYEGVSSPIEAGTDIESRYFGVTAATVQAENLIRSGFLALNDARKLKRRPAGIAKAEFRKVGVLGAGLMGSGIAYACA